MIVAVAVVSLLVLLLLIIFFYSSFLSFVRENVDLFHRLLNVLYCQLAVLYLVLITCHVGDTLSHVWWNFNPPTNIQNIFHRLFVILVPARGILFLQITGAILLKWVPRVLTYSAHILILLQEVKTLRVHGSICLDKMVNCRSCGCLDDPSSIYVDPPHLWGRWEFSALFQGKIAKTYGSSIRNYWPLLHRSNAASHSMDL